MSFYGILTLVLAIVYGVLVAIMWFAGDNVGAARGCTGTSRG